MNWALMLPVFLGLAAVIQGGLNRQIARHWGLAGTVFLNNLVFLFAGFTFFMLVKKVPAIFPEFLRDKGSFTNFSWWYLIPGLCGFTLVLGISYAISRIGALKLFIGVIGAQMIASLIWDATIENTPITMIRVLGAILAFASALMVGWKG